MKKTLLAVALLIAGTSVFAQVNKVKTQTGSTTQQVEKAVNLDKCDLSKLNQQQNKKTVLVKGGYDAENTELICDFSDPTSYEAGVKSWHTFPSSSAITRWQIKSDTSNWADNTFSFRNWFNNGSFYLLEEENRGNMSAHNGFAYFDFYTLSQNSITNGTIDAFITFKTPISTYGKRGVDIHLNQWIYRGNFEEYYIEWSHDINFPEGQYDSIEFNVRGTDIDVFDQINGPITIPIPTIVRDGEGNDITKCKVISTNPSEQTYFRIRIKNNRLNAMSVFYIVDDIAWSEAPEYRLELTNTRVESAYSLIPSIIKATDPIVFATSLANTGAKEIQNITLENKMYYVIYDDNGEMTDKQYVGDNKLELGSLEEGAFTDTTEIATNQYTYATRKFYDIRTDSISQSTSEGIGTYLMYSTISYNIGDHDTIVSAFGFFSNGDTTYTYYNVGDVSSLESAFDNAQYDNVYRWRRDGNVLCLYPYKNTAFTFSVKDNVYTSGDQSNYKSAGYKVCMGFEADEFDGDVYINGVELVTAPDSTSYTNEANRHIQAGAAIKASLMKLDKSDGITWQERIINATNDDGIQYQSDPYEIVQADINSYDDEEMDGTEHTYQIRANNAKSIFLPFNNGSQKMVPEENYYICYEMVDDGKFSVAMDWGYLNAFGYCGSARGGFSVFVKSPGTADNSYGWGTPYYGSLLDYQAPLIRMIVSNTPNGLAEVNSESGVDVNIYPNPNPRYVSYTLAESGKMVMTVTDLMGRTVYTSPARNVNAHTVYQENIPNLENGTYFCTININGNKSTQKFIVNK